MTRFEIRLIDLEGEAPLHPGQFCIGTKAEVYADGEHYDSRFSYELLSASTRSRMNTLRCSPYFEELRAEHEGAAYGHARRLVDELDGRELFWI
jgi:hypothetical protein